MCASPLCRWVLPVVLVLLIAGWLSRQQWRDGIAVAGVAGVLMLTVAMRRGPGASCGGPGRGT